jgi:hypothetical protein
MTTPDQRPSPSEPDELAPLDDAVIGRAFRWSFIAFITLLVAGAGLYLALRPRARTAETRLTQLSAPTVPQKPVAEVPAAKFTDITTAAGITFVHQNGAYGVKLLPETMGGGVAFFDFDNDAAPDLLFINSTTWPWTRGVAGVAPAPLPQMALYHNDGHGQFTDITAGSGFDVSLYGMGVAVGDYDNNGRVDVFITAVGGNRLFHNEGGGRFRDVTADAGVGARRTTGAPAPPGSTTTMTAVSTSSWAITSAGRARSILKWTTSSSASAAPTASRTTSKAPFRVST